MPKLPSLPPALNQSLSALLWAAVAAQYFATIGALIGAVPLLLMGAVLGAFAGIIPGIHFGVRSSAGVPLRESLVLFMGCVLAEAVTIDLGYVANWNSPTTVICALIIGPVFGLVLHKCVVRFAQSRCRQIAEVLTISASTACFWAYFSS